MSETTARVRVPETAAVGEEIEIRSMLTHPHESGERVDEAGNPIPRHIVERFECLFNGQEVFSAELHPSIAANPYTAFHLRIEESGRFEFRWTDDRGEIYTAEAEITVA